jgi:hypothetical protein
MRLNMSNLGREEGADVDPDTIYYLKTSKPHIKDISVSGPYYPWEHLTIQVVRRLEHEGSTAGVDSFIEMIEDGTVAVLAHFKAPLPDGNIIRFDIIREKNAEVARIWPGDVWFVKVSEPDMNDRSVTTEYPPMHAVELRGTFRTKEEANQRAREVVDEMKEEAGRNAHVTRHLENGLFQGMVIAGRRYAKLIEVVHDQGQIVSR